jgi:disulfide bond formation protein DsbB
MTACCETLICIFFSLTLGTYHWWQHAVTHTTTVMILAHCQTKKKYQQGQCKAWRIPSPKNLTLWPWSWKSIGFQILLRTNYVPSLVKIHWRMLILIFFSLTLGTYHWWQHAVTHTTTVMILVIVVKKNVTKISSSAYWTCVARWNTN